MHQYYLNGEVPSPVQYAILNNEKETGYSIMIMNEGVDEGKILLKRV